MKEPLSKCLDCKDRHVGCHSKCEKYKAFRKALDEYREQVREDKGIDQLVRHRPWMRKGSE